MRCKKMDIMHFSLFREKCTLFFSQSLSKVNKCDVLLMSSQEKYTQDSFFDHASKFYFKPFGDSLFFHFLCVFSYTDSAVYYLRVVSKRDALVMSAGKRNKRENKVLVTCKQYQIKKIYVVKYRSWLIDGDTFLTITGPVLPFN